jgi:hypothetical protein
LQIGKYPERKGHSKMKEKVEFARFPAKDKHGRVFTVVGFQNYVSHNPVYGSPVILKGDVEYWTDSGLPVRQIDSETYRIVTSKETITRFY